jgi:NDP-sugar pyrophosphorylase family protein
MILHQIEALAAAGVTDIVLAVNYRPEIMEKYLAEVRTQFHLHSDKALYREWEGNCVYLRYL